MGAYTAFLDVALGFGSPALGLVAGWGGLSSVFLAGALLVLSASVIALRLLYKSPAASTQMSGDHS
jgi:predicted MFS family arabinose efflux permease